MGGWVRLELYDPVIGALGHSELDGTFVAAQCILEPNTFDIDLDPASSFYSPDCITCTCTRSFAKHKPTDRLLGRCTPSNHV